MTGAILPAPISSGANWLLDKAFAAVRWNVAAVNQAVHVRLIADPVLLCQPEERVQVLLMAMRIYRPKWEPIKDAMRCYFLFTFF